MSVQQGPLDLSLLSDGICIITGAANGGIGFGIATIIFGVMTTLVLGEIPNQRIIVSLILAALILYINIAPTLK